MFILVISMPELELPEVIQSTTGSWMEDTIYGSEERAGERGSDGRGRREKPLEESKSLETKNEEYERGCGRDGERVGSE